MITILLILFIVLLLSSAFFSGSETALFSLTRARLMAWKNDNSPAKKRTALLMGSSYNKTLIALVLGNMFVNSALSMTGNELMTHLSNSPLVTTILSIVVSIILLLLIGEITPKSFALIYPEEISLYSSGTIYFMRKILSPFIFVIEKTFSVILDVLGRKESQPLNQEEYASYLDMAYSVGAFSGEETELISNIFTLRDLKINSVMRARVDIVSIKRGMDPDKISAKIQKSHELFYPVIDKNVDDAEKFISARDFYLIPAERRTEWEDSCTFDAIFIPENTSLTKGLALMKKNSVPAALVTDEYGGITGMLKLKDIYEELLGDVNAEFEEADWQIEKIGRHSWILNGNIPLQEIEELTGVNCDELPVNTLNGLFCEVRDDIPEEGESIEYSNIRIKALKVENNRIVKAEMNIISPEEGGKE
jgi:CBS domain containing-hemolysin-like protein